MPIGKPRALQRRGQARHGEVVCLRAGAAEAVPDKARRTADDDGRGLQPVDQIARIRRRVDHAGDDEADEIFEREAAAENAGRGEFGIGEVGLDRLDQPSFSPRLEIGVDGGGPGKSMGPPVRIALAILEIEKRAEGRMRDAAMVQGDKVCRPRRRSQRQCAVRRAEIEADKHGVTSHPSGRRVRATAMHRGGWIVAKGRRF
nr:hypothetical protein DBT53_13195 [Aerococcus mictus]